VVRLETIMKTNNENGFSLLELTVAMLLTVGILGAVFALMNRNQEIYVGESNVTDMNQNVRLAMDLLTRDIQSAGMGLPRTNGSFAAIYYKDGANQTPDSLLILNGDPFAPAAEVKTYTASSSEFLCLPPTGLTTTGSGSSIQFSFKNQDKQLKGIYKNSNADPRLYICYDEKKAMIMSLAANGTLTGVGANQRLRLQYTPASYKNPATLFGSALDQGEPDYNTAKIALLSGMISYRLNPETRELERTEDLTNWYAVARGVTAFQVEYRVISKDGAGNAVESVATAPADREMIRSVVITLSAETPDLDPESKGYRQVIHRFEIAPRNFNLLNNTNLSSNLN
jgi:Tfp pilus assembly protein PilW